MGLFLAVVAAFLFSVGNLLVRHGTDRLDRDAGFLLATTVNTIILVTLATCTLAAHGLGQGSILAVVLFAAGGLFGTFCGRWTNLRSIQRLGPSRASIFKNSQPLFTTAIAVPFLGEPLGLGSFLGGALIMIGIWLLTTEPAHQRASRLWDIRPEDRRGGIALGLVSAIAYGIGNILRKLGIRLWAEPAVGAGVAIIFTMIPVLMTPTIWGQRSRLRRPWHGGHVLFVAWGVCTSVAQLAFFTAVKFSPVWMITVVMAVEPLLTMLLSFVFYRGQEQLGRWVLLSAALVVAGLAGLAVLTP